MKLLSLPVIALSALVTPAIAQTVAPSNLVGTWSGTPAKGGSKTTYTLVMKADSTYTETTNGTNEKEKPSRWRVWGDSIWFGKEAAKYKIKLQNTGQEFILWYGADTTTRGSLVYKRVDTPKP